MQTSTKSSRLLCRLRRPTRFFLSGTGFSSDITLIEFEPVEDGSPGVGFGPLPKVTECADLAVLSSTSATCTAVLSAAADYSLKLYLADDTTFVPSVTLTAIPADEGPALPVIFGLTDSQDGTLPVNGAAAGETLSGFKALTSEWDCRWCFRRFNGMFTLVL